MVTFEQLMQGFGVVTVMNATIYKLRSGKNYVGRGACLHNQQSENAFVPSDWECTGLHLDTLKIANLNQEGPTKTITGGQYASPLIKYGKTMTCEMQDALGRAAVMVEFFGCDYNEKEGRLSVSDRFPGAFAIEGDTFFIDQKTGEKHDVYIFIPQFLPDAILNLTQDAEGDATVFDLNGTLNVTKVKDTNDTDARSIFYEIRETPFFGKIVNDEITYETEMAESANNGTGKGYHTEGAQDNNYIIKNGAVKKKIVTQFQVNQTSEGIKFDITQEPDLSQFTIPSTYSLRRVGESLVLLEGKAEGSEADTSEPILEVVSLTNSVKAIVANSENVIYSDSTQDTIKKGWSSSILKANGFYYWENNGVKQSYEITSVNNVANWNGTLAKSIEKEAEAPQETLVPFTVGQHINGVTIDPTAKTDEEMIEWLNTFSVGAGTDDYVVLLKGKQGGDVVDRVLAGLQGNIRTLAFMLTEDTHLWFMSEGMPEAGIESKGWYIINEKAATSTRITEKTTLNGDTYEIAEIADKFAFLNGIVLGAVEASEEALVPFTVGQRIKGVTIDPTAKTNEEITEWLNTLSYTPGDGGLTVLLSGKDSEANSNELVMVGENNGIKMLVFNITSDLFLYFVAEDVPGMVSKGWNIQDENNGNTITPVTEKTTFNGDTYEIATIAEQFAFLNGTVLGAVEGEAPQETLTPFRAGQHITAIKIDTNAKTNEELAAFAAQLDSGSGIDEALVTYHNNEWPLISVQGSADFGYFIDTESNDAGDSLIWVSKAMDLDSVSFTSAGWYLANENTSSLEEVSGIVELQLNETILVDDINTAFSELNGTVFGAVEAAREPLIPFRDGQRISGIVVDPTVKTDEEIANWLNNLTNEQRLVELNEPNGIGVAEISGVKTLTMFLDPVWITFSADAISGDTSIPKGWSYKEQSSGSAEFMPITERTLLGFNTLEVTTVHSEFDFLNGIVVGVNEVEVPTTTLTNIEVGQRLKGIKFDTTKTPDLSQFTMGEYGLCNLINSTDDEGTPQDGMFGVGDLSTMGLGNGRVIVVAGTQCAYSEIEINNWGGNGQHIPQGWNTTYLDENGVGLFKESEAEPLECVNVTEVIDGHLWNGIFAGAVLADSEPETPTTFVDGQTINGITVSPNVKTDTEMIEWLNGFSETTVLVDTPRAEVQIPLTGAKTFGIALSNNKQIMFVSEDTTIKGSAVTKGWHCLEGTETLTGQQSIQSHSTYSGDTYTVAGITEGFAFLNGIVLGAVVATNVPDVPPDVPQETLVQFTKGQTISAIKVNTNAKTNDELSTFAAKALEGQVNTKTLVSKSVGTDIVGVQGSAESGYIITAASDTKNNILWVSKGLDLDGKFTFPSAGWYLVNKNDGTFSVTSGIVELPFTGTVTIGENIDAAFNSELNGVVFGVVAA